MKTLGDLIKEYREEHSLSLRDFANLCEVSHSYVDKLEKGIDPRSGKPVEPTLDVIEKLAKALGLSLESLLRNIGKLGDSHESTAENLPSEVKGTESDGLIISTAERDIEKCLEKLLSYLQSKPDYFTYSGKPMSPETVETIISTLEFGMKQAKIINKRYTSISPKY